MVRVILLILCILSGNLGGLRASAVNYQWFLSDRMGSVQAVTDKDSNVLESYSYSAFGVRSIQNSSLSIPNWIGFTGREHDVETGLTYYRARYMDPVLGRFISEDPIGFGEGDPNYMLLDFNKGTFEKLHINDEFADYNLNRGFLGNPNNYVDPYGLSNAEDVLLRKQLLGIERAAAERLLAREEEGTTVRTLCNTSQAITLVLGVAVSGLYSAYTDNPADFVLEEPPPLVEIVEKTVCKQKRR